MFGAQETLSRRRHFTTWQAPELGMCSRTVHLSGSRILVALRMKRRVFDALRQPTTPNGGTLFFLFSLFLKESGRTLGPRFSTLTWGRHYITPK